MPGPALLSRPFVLCFAANLVQGLSFNLFLHFPGFLNELGAGDVEIGLITGIAGVAAIGVRPPIGPSMDRRGRRGVFLLGGVLNVLACAGYLAVTQIGPLVYALRVLHGLGEAMVFTALFTYGADHVPAERRTQGLALFGVSGMLPISLGAKLGDVILSRADYTTLFAAAAALSVLSLLLSLPLRDRVRDPVGAEPARGFRAALAQRDLLPLWWVGGVFATALASVFVFFKRYVDETGIGSVGDFFSAYAITAILLRVFAGWLPDRVGPKRVLLPALVALATAFMLLAGAESAGEVLVAGVLFGVGHGFTFPILFGILVTRAGEADRGSAMAIFTALFDTGVLVGGPLFGALITWAGFSTMFVSAAAAIAVGMVVFAVWDRGR
jgi:MFS family permease